MLLACRAVDTRNAIRPLPLASGFLPSWREFSSLTLYRSKLRAWTNGLCGLLCYSFRVFRLPLLSGKALCREDNFSQGRGLRLLLRVGSFVPGLQCFLRKGSIPSAAHGTVSRGGCPCCGSHGPGGRGEDDCPPAYEQENTTPGCFHM